jgi:hypothetical protein
MSDTPDQTRPWEDPAPGSGHPEPGAEGEVPTNATRDWVPQQQVPPAGSPYRPPATAGPAPAQYPPRGQYPPPANSGAYPPRGTTGNYGPYQPAPGPFGFGAPPAAGPGFPPGGYPGGAPYQGAPGTYPGAPGAPTPAEFRFDQPRMYGTGPQGYSPPGRRRSRWPLLLAGVVVVVLAAVAVTGFWVPGFFKSSELDVNQAQAGVKQILTDPNVGYGAANVTDVRCNNGANPTISAGATFTCDATINGAKHQVTVTFQDDAGTYGVGRPR